MSAFEKSVSCKDVAPLLVFYACDEVSDSERKQIEKHVANCEACAAQLAEERNLLEAIAAAPKDANPLKRSKTLVSHRHTAPADALHHVLPHPLEHDCRPCVCL